MTIKSHTLTPVSEPKRRTVRASGRRRLFCENGVDSSVTNILSNIARYNTSVIILHSLTTDSSLRAVDRHIPHIETPLTIATIGWFIPFSIVLLLPIDLASTKADNICERDSDSCSRPWFYLDPKSLQLCWRIGYWTTFALTWYYAFYITLTAGPFSLYFKAIQTQVIVLGGNVLFLHFVRIFDIKPFSSASSAWVCYTSSSLSKYPPSLIFNPFLLHWPPYTVFCSQ